MNPSLYRIWLPVSILLHVILLWLLQLLPPVTPQVQGDNRVPITVTVVEPPAPHAAKPPVKVIPPPEPPKTLPTPVILPKVSPREAQPMGTHPNGTASRGGNTLQPVTGGNSTQPGTGKQPTAPPSLMTSTTGTEKVPPGLPDSTGTMGKTPVPSGPSYGAEAQGGALPGYPKLAEEAGTEGTVVLEVSVNGDGSIAAVSVAQSSGSDLLDRAAMRAIRAWKFSGAMTNGQAGSGTVKVGFRFSHDKVERAL